MKKSTSKAEMIARLKAERQRKAEAARAREEAGRAAGAAWALTASLDQLQLFEYEIGFDTDHVLEQYMRSPEDGPEDTTHDGPVEAAEREECRALLAQTVGSPADVRRDLDYARGYLDGALDTWKEVRAEVEGDDDG
jgi:hypothetical protein